MNNDIPHLPSTILAGETLSLMLALDHLQIAAPQSCEVAAREFFGGLLGLEEVAKPAALASRGGVWFELAGGQQLHIGTVAPEDFTPAVKAHPGFRVEPDELDRLAAALTHAGHPVVWAQPGEIPGLRRLHTLDPWGNRIELLAAAS